MKSLLFSLCLFCLSCTAISQNLEIYVSDAGNFDNPPWQILKFDANGENPEVFIDDHLVWPQDIVFLESQDVVLISNLTIAGYISKHEISTGEFIGNFAEGISGPTRMKIGADGLLYVLQWDNTNNKVLRYQLDGTFVDEFTTTGVAQSIGLDWDNSGNLYVSSYGGDFVHQFDTVGNDMGRFIDANLLGPTNIWFDGNGDLMVVDYNGGAVKRFDASGEYINNFIEDLHFPEGVDFFPNGDILIGNGGTGAVKLFDADGNFIDDFIPAGTANLIRPNAVVIREVTPVSVQDNALEGNFITPTVGHTFFIQSDLIPGIASVSIIQSTGAVVAELNIESKLRWDAGHLPGGIYLAIATTSDGRVVTQKIIIR